MRPSWAGSAVSQLPRTPFPQDPPSPRTLISRMPLSAGPALPSNPSRLDPSPRFLWVQAIARLTPPVFERPGVTPSLTSLWDSCSPECGDHPDTHTGEQRLSRTWPDCRRLHQKCSELLMTALGCELVQRGARESPTPITQARTGLPWRVRSRSLCRHVGSSAALGPRHGESQP